MVLAFDAKPHWPDTPAFLRLYVEDADATFQRALDAGGIAVTTLPTCSGAIGSVGSETRWGNLWWIQARVEEVDEAEIGRRMATRSGWSGWPTSRAWIRSPRTPSSRGPRLPGLFTDPGAEVTLCLLWRPRQLGELVETGPVVKSADGIGYRLSAASRPASRR